MRRDCYICDTIGPEPKGIHRVNVYVFVHELTAVNSCEWWNVYSFHHKCLIVTAHIKCNIPAVVWVLQIVNQDRRAGGWTKKEIKKRGDGDGWREPDRSQRGRNPLRDLQDDPEKDSGHPIIETDRGPRQLRSNPQRIFLRSPSGRLLADPQLLQDGQAPLSVARVRATLRRGTGILGARLQSSRALLLDDLHRPQRHPGNIITFSLSLSKCLVINNWHCVREKHFGETIRDIK